MDISQTDIRLLADILRTNEESSDSDDDLPRVGASKMGPGDIGTKYKVKAGKESDVANEKEGEVKEVKNDKNIWEEYEIPCGIRYDEDEDPRTKPEYDIKYKQAVTAEDMFLQMGPKTPSSVNCEGMVVSIHLPNESQSDVDLDVTEQVLDLRSPKYRLSLPLPHPVKTTQTKAVWDPEKEQLQVNLVLDRLLDFYNI